MEVNSRTVEGSFELASASDAVQMIQDAFGFYRAVIGDQSPETQRAAWAEVLDVLKGFEGADGLRVPAQMQVAGARRPI